MKRLCVLILAPLFSASALFSADDISGRYRAEIKSPSGGSMSLTGYLVLRDSVVEGSFGPTPAKAVPISEGRAVEGKISFVIPPLDNSRFLLERFDGGFIGTIAEGTGLKSPFKAITLTRLGPLGLSDLIRPLPNEGEHRSPRLLQLRNDLAGDRDAKLAEFWDEIGRAGTPIVEKANEESTLVSFVWRGRPEDKNVLVLWMPFAAHQPARFFMQRIPDTDLWFLTLSVPVGSRFAYRLSPNDPAATNPPGAVARKAMMDPLNRRGGRVDLSRPASTVDRIAVEPMRLSVQEHTLKSEVLRQDRKVLVYVPAGYVPAEQRSQRETLSTLYLFDGEDRDGTVFATRAVETLLAAGRIPPLIVVRVINPDQAARQTQLACHEPFLRFMSDELVPFIRARYKVSVSPQRTAIGGYSLGGLAAAFAGLRRPDVFGLVISQSGSFWWEPTGREWAEPNWIARQFLATSKLPLRFYLEAGLFELDLTGKGGSALLPNRHLRDVLLAKGYDVQYREFPGGHESVNWGESFPQALQAVFGSLSGSQGRVDPVPPRKHR